MDAKDTPNIAEHSANITETTPIDNTIVLSLFTDSHTPYLDGDILSRGWAFYDWDNLLPQRLTDLYINSPAHSSIVNKKVDLISGQEIKVSESAKHFENEIDNGGGLQQLIRKIALDLVMFGGFALEIVPKKHMKGIGDIVHVNFQNCRVGIQPNSNNSFDKGVWFSKDWAKPTYKHKPIFFKNYNFEHEQESTIFYYKMYTPLSAYYPLPTYFSAYNSILTECELINFTKNLVQNSFVPSGILQVSSNMTNPAMEKFKTEFANEFIGTGNSGKVILMKGNKENPVTYIPFTNSPADRDVSNLIDTAREDIILAHEVPSPTIIGLPSGASLAGDGSSIEAGRKYFMDSVIIPMRQIIIDKLKDLFTYAGKPTNIEVLDTKGGEEQNVEAVSRIAEFGAGGLQSLSLLQQNVAGGLLTPEVGISTLQIVYGFTEQEAKQLLGIQ